jgi:hypothetical protein
LESSVGLEFADLRQKESLATADMFYDDLLVSLRKQENSRLACSVIKGSCLLAPG